jgi:hypothetical protein
MMLHFSEESAQSIMGKTELTPPNAIQQLDGGFTNRDEGGLNKIDSIKTIWSRS